MKTPVPLVALYCSFALCNLMAQGLVNFVNGPNSLVSVGPPGLAATMNGSPGDYYFALLTSPVDANTFTFSGVYGTNEAVAGLFSGGMGVVVNGWAPGTARDFLVVGWSAGFGPVFNPSWLTTPSWLLPPDSLGESAIGRGVAGGPTSSGVLPNLEIFGGPSGIQSGFLLLPPQVPEPPSMALAGLGAMALLMFSLPRARTIR